MCLRVCGWNTSRAWGQSSASSQTDDPADRLTFGGLTAGGEGRLRTGPARERREDGERGGEKMELEEVKFRTEGRKVRTKGNLKRKSAGGETDVVTTVDLEHILVVFVDPFCCALPWFWCLALV